MIAVSLALAFAAVGASLEEGTLLTYRGTFEAVKVEPSDAPKSFELQLLVGGQEGAATAVYWQLFDQGPGTTPWMERFGKLAWHADSGRVDGARPSFVFRHATGESTVGVFPPLPHFGRKLGSDQTWTRDGIEFSVSSGEEIDGKATWLVEARTQIGRRRAMQVDRENSLVMQLKENVFVGQGQEHTLKYKLEKTELLSRERIDAAAKVFDAWTIARDDWNKTLAEKTSKSVPVAHEALEKLLPELKKKSAETFFAPLAASVAKELKSSDERMATVGALRSRAIGKPIAKFALKDSANREWTNDSLTGKVTVLHFWTYRDENLREPYGQVGYLDFLARKYDAKKVQFAGVAVFPESRDAFANQRSAVRKFREFMNVSFPVILDDETLLKSLGDPRIGGQELPLFVVIDAKGKVVEYKAGHYEVRRDEGLSELDAAIKKAGG